ncbi:hypothetical protein, partial [Klebsiella pneumoniae]
RPASRNPASTGILKNCIWILPRAQPLTLMDATVFVPHDAVTTEVVMAYSNSNIDLPYIAYALHDSPA